MITRVNISFFRYHSKETETGEAPLYCRLWHENKRKIFSIGFKITRNKWNQNKQMATGKSEMAQRINTQMEVIKNKLVEIETRLIIEDLKILWKTSMPCTLEKQLSAGHS